MKDQPVHFRNGIQYAQYAKYVYVSPYNKRNIPTEYYNTSRISTYNRKHRTGRTKQTSRINHRNGNQHAWFAFTGHELDKALARGPCFWKGIKGKK